MRFWTVVRGVVGFLASAGLFMASTNAGDLATNFASYVALVSHNVPIWLQTTSADKWIGIGSACVLVLLGSSTFRHWFKHRRYILTAEIPDRPDTSLTEAFWYIALDSKAAKPDREGDYLLGIYADLRQKALFGDLKIWGRPVTVNMLAKSNPREPLRLIRPEYWDKGTFDYFSLAVVDRGEALTENARDYRLGQEEYRDLQVNMKEVRQLWPEASQKVRKANAELVGNYVGAFIPRRSEGIWHRLRQGIGLGTRP